MFYKDSFGKSWPAGVCTLATPFDAAMSELQYSSPANSSKYDEICLEHSEEMCNRDFKIRLIFAPEPSVYYGLPEHKVRTTTMKQRACLVATILLLSTAAWSADVAILRAQIEKVIPKARGEVGVAIKHVESGTEVLVNADKTYPMASTYKVPILTEIFYQRAAGRLALSDRIEVTPADVHPGGTIALLLDGPGLQMSIHNLINLMMRVSDNSAADILINKVGAANVTARIKNPGLDNIRVDRTY